MAEETIMHLSKNRRGAIRAKFRSVAGYSPAGKECGFPELTAQLYHRLFVRKQNSGENSSNDTNGGSHGHYKSAATYSRGL